MIYFELFYVFFIIGLFTFGGGYAMISLIEHTCIDQKAWITHDEMMNVTVIAESTPGPIAINCATFVGYRQKGFVGALVATLGMTLPSFCIIYLISMFLDDFLDIAWIANAFEGIKIAVGLLILATAFTMLKKTRKKRITDVIMLCSFGAMLLIDLFALQFSTIALLLVAGMISLLLFVVQECTGRNGGAEK